MLNTIANGEYRLGSESWQTSAVFSGLQPNTPYAFTQRYAQTATHFASNASDEAIFSTQTVGINVNIFSHYTLYPNPTSDIVYIKTESDSIPEIKLFSVDDRLLQQVRSVEIDMSKYDSGIYFMQIEREVVKIVKK